MGSGGIKNSFKKQIAPKERVLSRVSHAAVCERDSPAQAASVEERRCEDKRSLGLVLLPGSCLASFQAPHLFLWPRSLLTWENIFTSLPLFWTSYKDLRWDGNHFLGPKGACIRSGGWGVGGGRER